ncbi:MAG: hypothetical protein NC117_08940 [Pseudoflavonifractor sp.]|nr:hypothetical protein [Pseudoflavonifractor sp.]
MTQLITRYLPSMLAATVALLASSCSGDEPAPDGGTPTPDAAPGRVKVTVIDYSPAPGQFVNEIPEYEPGDTPATMAAKATESLDNDEMITLGAWGGSVTLRLHEPIANVAGKADFRVLGNAYYADGSTSLPRYGNAEPGIVYVLHDADGDGPDNDTWYELDGSERAHSAGSYRVTYTVRQADAANHITWTSADGSNGVIPKLTAHHNHSYYPQWLGGTTLIFEGRRLPDNGVLVGDNYRLTCYDGYADCHPNDSDASALDIDNAIDASGNRVSLPSIEYVKVVTGVLQVNGWLGECSTEIRGIERL